MLPDFGLLIFKVFIVYVVTLTLVGGNIFYRFRVWFKEKTPWLYKGLPYKHLIDCRLCTGFWVSLAASPPFLFSNTPFDFLFIWGASYWITTFER